MQQTLKYKHPEKVPTLYEPLNGIKNRGGDLYPKWYKKRGGDDFLYSKLDKNKIIH